MTGSSSNVTLEPPLQSLSPFDGSDVTDPSWESYPAPEVSHEQTARHFDSHTKGNDVCESRELVHSDRHALNVTEFSDRPWHELDWVGGQKLFTEFSPKTNAARCSVSIAVCSLAVRSYCAFRSYVVDVRNEANTPLSLHLKKIVFSLF